jgi:PAS domain-containing protein
MFDQDWRLSVVAVCGLLAGAYGLWRCVISVAISLGRGRRARRLVAIAIDNMTQGVVMFDATERMVVCNDRFSTCAGYRVRSSPAVHFDVINNRKTTGSLDIDGDTAPRSSPR